MFCSLSDAIEKSHKDYLENGNTTFVDNSNLLDAFRGRKMLDSGSGKEWKSALSRRKRDLLFPNGVKLCSHETVQQAIQNHLNYFHLRGKNMIVWLLLVLECFWCSHSSMVQMDALLERYVRVSREMSSYSLTFHQ